MRRLLWIAVVLAWAIPQAHAGACANSTIGAYSCVDLESVDTSSVLSTTVTYASSTSGQVIFGVGWQSTSGTTLTVTSCASASVVAVGTTLAWNGSATMTLFEGKVNSTASCTLTLGTGTSGELLIAAVWISGSNGTLDTHATTASLGSIASGGAATSPTVSPLVSGDLLLAGFVDGNFNMSTGCGGCTFTSGSSSVVLANKQPNDVAITAIVDSGTTTEGVGVVATTAGGPTVMGSGTVAIEPTGGGASGGGGTGGKAGFGGKSGIGL